MAAAALVGCSDDIIPGDVPSGEGGADTGEMVFFSSGTTENAVSRAASTYYMPDGYRFVCRMYYKAQTGSEDFDVSGATDHTAWLKVGGAVGNSLYWNKEFRDVNTSIKGVGGVDEYGNDFSAHAFYWQNRKPHAFLAWTDLNQAISIEGGDESGKLSSHGTAVYKEKKKVDDQDVEIEYRCNAFDLTRGTKTSMAEQPDIAQALTLQAPTGASQEANRVNLYFKHQFSQVQVNVKNADDNSVQLVPSQILKIELLGVTEEGYVFTDLDANGKVRPAAYKAIDFSKYNEAHLKDNRYGTAFEMFDMYDASKGESGNWGYEKGFLKSFNCITFGQLQAIRITWKEEDTTDGEGNVLEGIRHVATFRIPDATLVNLKSGCRYVWNIEIRRGTLAIIRTEIIDWEVPTDDPHNGQTDGTIKN